MAKSSIDLTGTNNKTYDLDTLSASGLSNVNTALVVQVWLWCPDLPSDNTHSKPNPPDLVVGQMWLSKLIKKGSPEYKTLLKSGSEG